MKVPTNFKMNGNRNPQKDLNITPGGDSPKRKMGMTDLEICHTEGRRRRFGNTHMERAVAQKPT